MTSYAFTAKSAVSARRLDNLQFRLIFAVSFVVFLTGALFIRLMPNHWKDNNRRSVFAQAWEASGTAAQIAFSG
jgi:hypothetical protein